ncbi:MAG: hypothetical protein LBG45_02675 [Dysgonamonadaceae bacterium]|jgi:hypothetical protein|nr:hypothetical protein [Dysgonamonadaceae bacterium]
MTVGFKDRFVHLIECGAKKHTIREDRKDRICGGATLHLSTGVRTKNYRCFKKVLCTGTQRIIIRYNNGGYHDVFVYQDVCVCVDGRELGYREIDVLAKNDGFENQNDFFKWFKSDFSGKIIHWTTLKY